MKKPYSESDRINVLDRKPREAEASREAIFSVKHPDHVLRLFLTVDRPFLVWNRSIAQSLGTEFPSKKWKYFFRFVRYN